MCSSACMHAGAPNFIMAECSSYMKADGSIAPLDDAAKKAFMDKVDELSEQALRVLAIACVHVGKDLPFDSCLLYTSPSPRDVEESRMPSSA